MDGRSGKGGGVGGGAWSAAGGVEAASGGGVEEMELMGGFSAKRQRGWPAAQLAAR